VTTEGVAGVGRIGDHAAGADDVGALADEPQLRIVWMESKPLHLLMISVTCRP
jgi:hypothetical protein